MVADSDGHYGNVGQYTISGTIVPTATVNAPTNLTATAVSTSQVNLAWTDNATNETGYNIECSTNGVNWSVIASNLPANSTSYADATASAGTTYVYRVDAYNTSLTSNYSNQATATTVTVAPSGLTATPVSPGQVNLAWSNVTGEIGFRVERSLDGVTWGLVGTTGAGVTSYQDTTVSIGTSYQYRTEAVNSGGTSTCSNVAAATTPAAPVPPAAPLGLVAVAGSATRVTLTWHDNSSNESGFYIKRSTNGGKSWTQIAQVGSNVTSYTDTSVSAQDVLVPGPRLQQQWHLGLQQRGDGHDAEGGQRRSAAAPLRQASSAYKIVVPITPTWSGPAHRQAGTVAFLAQGAKGSPAIAPRFDLVDWALASPTRIRVLISWE